MITKTENLNIVDQVAKLFYPTNTLQQNVVKTRLKEFLTDDLFTTILARLSQGNFYAFRETNKFFHPQKGTFDSINNFLDIFLGQSGNGRINDIPIKDLLHTPAYYQKANLTYLGSVNVSGVVYDIVQNQNQVGYGITYNPQIGTGGGEADPIRGGLITVTPTNEQNELNGNAIKPTSNILGSMDLNSLLIPGALLIALYFMSKK